MTREATEPDPLPIQVTINKTHIWPSGQLGKVTITQQFGGDMDLTVDQAKTLREVLLLKLDEFYYGFKVKGEK